MKLILVDLFHCIPKLLCLLAFILSPRSFLMHFSSFLFCLFLSFILSVFLLVSFDLSLFSFFVSVSFLHSFCMFLSLFSTFFTLFLYLFLYSLSLACPLLVPASFLCRGSANGATPPHQRWTCLFHSASEAIFLWRLYGRLRVSSALKTKSGHSKQMKHAIKPVSF